MKTQTRICLSVALLFVFAAANAQQSAKDWYAKGVDAAFHAQKVEFFSRAIELDENYVDAYNARASAKSDLGMLKDAVTDYSIAIRIDSSNVTAFYNRGTCLFALGEYPKAILDFDQVIQLKPTHAYAMSGKGCAELLLGNTEKAVETLNQALWLEGSLQSALKCRDEALKQQQDPRLASIKTVKSPTPKTNTPSAPKVKTSPPASPSPPTASASTEASVIATYQLKDATSLREGPVHTTRVLLRFSAGDTVEVFEKTNGLWWKVRFKGKIGYVKAALLKEVN